MVRKVVYNQAIEELEMMKLSLAKTFEELEKMAVETKALQERAQTMKSMIASLEEALLHPPEDDEIGAQNMTSLAFPLCLAAVMTSLVLSSHENDVRCLSCTNVARPDHCFSFEMCNLDEVCFTHEVFDHSGARTFRLGCESRDVCRLIESLAGSTFGRRDVTESSDSDTPARCFQCCSSDDCNAALCEEVFFLNRTEPRPSHPGNCTPPFVKGPNSCLYFQDVPVHWSAARDSCRKLGADLVKVEDQTEDLFIVSQLKLQHLPPSGGGYWIGAHRDVVTNEFVWLDHTPVNYTRWGVGEPMKVFKDYYLMYSNPVKFSEKPNWEWADVPDNDYFQSGFICEKTFT